MARIPVYRDNASLDPGNVVSLPRRPGVPVLDAKARALAGFGGAIQSGASEIDALIEHNQATADDAWLSSARAKTGVDWAKTEYSLKTGGTPGVDAVGGIPIGLNDSAAPPIASIMGSGPAGAVEGATVGAFNSYRDGVLASAPSERAKRAYTEWSNGFGEEAQIRAFEFDQQSLVAKRSSDLNTAFNNHLQVVASDPTKFDETWKNVEADLSAAAAWMTPEQEVETRDKIRTAMELARATHLAKFNPLKFQEEIGTGDTPSAKTVNKIVAAESSGLSTAAATTSSATGPGQFIESTWLGLITKYRPDLAATLDRKTLLALRTNQALSREMVGRLVQDNSIALASAGLPVNEGTLYLAHFAGAGGATSVLTAPDGTPLSDVLDAATIKANPFLKGKDTTWLKNWAAAKMAGTAPAPSPGYSTNPYYSHMSPDQVDALSKDADSAVIKQHNSAVASATAEHAQQFNSLMVGIGDNTMGMGDVFAARKAGWLTDYDEITKAVDAINKRDKASISVAQALSKFADPSQQFNPFVTDDKNALDTAYKAMGGSEGLLSGGGVRSVGGVPISRAQTSDEALALVRQFTERGQIVPESAVASLRAGLTGRDPTAMQNAYDAMQVLYRENPGAVTRSFDSSDIKRMQDFEALSQMLPPDELAKYLNPFTDPTTAKIKDELFKEADTIIGDQKNHPELSNVDTLLSSLNTAAFGDYPSAPLDTIAQTAAMDDFHAAFRDRYAVSRDVELAKKQALELWRQKWGTTDAGSDLRVMAYPPERYYPPIDGNQDWMGDQLAQLVEKQAPDAQSFGIVVLPQTEAAVAAHVRPSYGVMIVDKDGNHKMLTYPNSAEPALYAFDYEKARADRAAKFETDRANAAKRAAEPYNWARQFQ